MYDVAVIGAGPGGSTTARYIAKQGFNVSLIDKDRFPRDKPCGGGFSTKLVEEFPYLKKSEKGFLKGVCHVGVLHSPNLKTVMRGRVDMAVALRTDFDNTLLESALDAGASLILGNRVKSISISNDFTTVSLDNGRDVSARVIVGADGVTSMVARATGLNTKWSSADVTACRVAEVPVDPATVEDLYTADREYHFFANLGGLPGYGWIFPKFETINVGLGIVANHAKGLPERFHSFAKFLMKQGLLNEDADLSNAKGALLPTGGTISKFYAKRCLLVGDSAGMVNPITGGGISYAMTAGRLAAYVLGKCLDDAVVDEDILSAYQKLWMQLFGNEIKSQLLVQKIFTGSFTSALFEIGSRDIVLQEAVSKMMSEASQEKKDITNLLGRFLYVCLREALSR
ncbi:MAG: geranylgeranyl reductase family protein [Candidatus Thorarchaeota archaeon]